MIRAFLVAVTLQWSAASHSFPCWMVHRAVAQYGAPAVESWARAKGIPEKEIQKARQCLK
jgi:hypothetical protein